MVLVIPVDNVVVNDRELLRGNLLGCLFLWEQWHDLKFNEATSLVPYNLFLSIYCMELITLILKRYNLIFLFYSSLDFILWSKCKVIRKGSVTCVVGQSMIVAAWNVKVSTKEALLLY